MRLIEENSITGEWYLSRATPPRRSLSLSRFRKTITFGFSSLVSVFSATFLLCTGCCTRLAMDGPARSFVPEVKGNATFVLEVYPSPNFDMAHEEVGTRRISMRDGELKPVPQNYVRSFILKSEPRTRFL